MRIDDTNIFTEIFRQSIAKINEDIEDHAIDRLLQDITIALDNDDLGKAFHALLINGLPLFFIEVKKPNNKKGILSERERIDRRFRNKSFKRFINITQMMVFSNNMEYSSDVDDPVEGAFYATTSYEKASFNFFRERESFNLAEILAPMSDATEDLVLQDTNYTSIKHTPEFATKAIEAMLNRGDKKGVVWHTQGSGKTALAFYNVAFCPTTRFPSSDLRLVISE